MKNIDIGEVIIRPAIADDLDAMCNLLYELFTIEKDFSPNPDKQRHGLGLLISTTGTLVLVADYDGNVVGMCTVQPLISTAEGNHVGLVEDVVVKRNCRRHGIGSRLLDAAHHWALSRGMSRLQLLADQHNVTALKFYSAGGWHSTNMVCLRFACV